MTEPRWLDQAEARAWIGYRRMFPLLNARLARDLTRDSGLSEPDYDVLSVLSETATHRYRVKDLAARMLWSQSRLSHHISRMRQRGLVDREECPDDARGAVVLLTDAGIAAIRAAAPDHVESVRRHFINLLTPGQIEALGDIAEVILRHLSEDGETS